MPKKPSRKKSKRSAEFKRRSVAAKKGWETRKARQLDLPLKGGKETAREFALGPASILHGKNLLDREILKEMILDNDERWVHFVNISMKFFSTDIQVIRNSWFSPKAQKVK